MIQLTIRVRTPTIPFLRTLHDYETPEWNHKPRSLFDPNDGLLDNRGYPEMIPLLNRNGTAMTEAIQLLWFEQLRRSAGNMTLEDLKKAWRNLTDGNRALTNHAGTDTRADLISRINLDADLPELYELTCGGNVLELVSFEIYSFLGEAWYKIKTLDPNRVLEYRTWNRTTHPQFFQVATNSTPFGFDGEVSRTPPWKVNQFPQLDGPDVIFPLFSAGGFNYIKTNRVKIMSPQDVFPPRPYNP